MLKLENAILETSEKSAVFSDCHKYRYLLSRNWSNGPVAMCIGLNPSTASGEQNDPTINNLIKALKFLGFGGLRMVNLYAYIATKPAELWASENPIGPTNNEWLLTTAYSCQEIIFCWGSFKRYRGTRQKDQGDVPLRQMLRQERKRITAASDGFDVAGDKRTETHKLLNP